MKRLLAIALALLLAGAAWGAPAYVQGNDNALSGNQTVITVALTGVTAGNLIVVFAGWENGATPTVSDGTSSLDAVTQVAGGGRYGQMFYLLAANSGNLTYTVTFGATVVYPMCWVMEFSGGTTWTYDTANGTSGSGTASASGNITTTGTNEVVVNGTKLFGTAATTSSPLINGVTPTEPAWSPVGTYDHAYYRILTVTFSNGQAALTYDTSTAWINALAAFKAPATTYTVTYDGNGSTGGTVPTDASSPYAASATVTVIGNTGSLVRTGGYAFSAWNTAADYSGTSYAAADTFSMPAANTVLYATWTTISGTNNAAATAQYDDVVAAIATADRGDTVTIPAGDVIWPASVSITKGLVFQGAGIDTTIIHGGSITVTAEWGGILIYEPDATAITNNEAFRVTGFTFDGDWNSSGVVIAPDTIGVPLSKIRIDHNKFIDCGNATYSMRGVEVFFGAVFGVIDNNQFIDCYKSVDTYGDGWLAWDDDSDPHIGAAGSLYIESNTFEHTDARVCSGITSSGWGGRYVFRYNTIVNPYDYDILDIHGNQEPVTAPYSPGGSRGTISAEIYENTVTTDRSSHRFLNIRGGTVLVYNNTITQTGYTAVDLSLIEEDAPALLNLKADYPGYDPVKNTYIWGNTLNSAALSPSVNVDSGLFIQINRDYWTSAKPGYAAYTYPHPLRGEGGSVASSGQTAARVVILFGNGLLCLALGFVLGLLYANHRQAVALRATRAHLEALQLAEIANPELRAAMAELDYMLTHGPERPEERT